MVFGLLGYILLDYYKRGWNMWRYSLNKFLAKASMLFLFIFIQNLLSHSIHGTICIFTLHENHENQPNVYVNTPYMDGMGIEYKYINLYTIKQPRTSRGYTSQQPFDFHPSPNLGIPASAGGRNDPSLETDHRPGFVVSRFAGKKQRGQTKNSWAMKKKTWLFSLYRGWTTTQLYGGFW